MKLVFRVTICAIASSDSLLVAVSSISAVVDPEPSETLLSSVCVSVNQYFVVSHGTSLLHSLCMWRFALRTTDSLISSNKIKGPKVNCIILDISLWDRTLLVWYLAALTSSSL